jgi:hypothetical protein
MWLESTILDNNKLIRNLKLQQVGMQQEDSQANSHTHIKWYEAHVGWFWHILEYASLLVWFGFHVM